MIKRRLLAFALAFILILPLSTIVYAAENSAAVESNENARAISDFYYIARDSEGNKYTITGYVTVVGKKAGTTTSFVVSHVASGEPADQDRLSKGEKKLQCGGDVTMLNGLNFAQTSFSGAFVSVTGLNNSTTAWSNTLLYTITGVTGRNYFAFPAQGVVVNGTSTY